MHFADEIAVQLSLLQCGVFARWQMLARGIDDPAIRRRTRSGRWMRHGPGVYGLAGNAPSFAQRCWIGWLGVGPGAIISHEAAAEVHGVPNVVRDRVTLITPHSNHCRIPGAFVHQISDVAPDQRTAVEGLPVTTVARTIVDLASVVQVSRLRHIVEDSKHARLTTYPAVGECLTSVARRGKPGVRQLTRVLDDLSGTKALTQSRLEAALVELLVRAGVTPFTLQFSHPGRLFTNGCVDVSFQAAKLVVEADGRAWHTRIKDLKRDHDRDAEAARAGWQTLRLLYEHVVGDPEGTAALMIDVLQTRLALFAAR